MSAAAPPVEAQVAGRSLWADAWAKLRRNRAATLSAWIIGAMAVLVLVGPFLSRYTYDFTDFANTHPAYFPFLAPYTFDLNASTFACLGLMGVCLGP